MQANAAAVGWVSDKKDKERNMFIWECDDAALLALLFPRLPLLVIDVGGMPVAVYTPVGSPLVVVFPLADLVVSSLLVLLVLLCVPCEEVDSLGGVLSVGALVIRLGGGVPGIPAIDATLGSGDCQSAS